MLIIVQMLAERFSFYLPVGLLMAMSLDMGYTLANLAAFQRTVQRLDRAIEQQKATLSESLEQRKTIGRNVFLNCQSIGSNCVKRYRS